MKKAPNVFDYRDYRVFLKDYYEAKKVEMPVFSHRYIGTKIGFDGGFFSKILAGKRQINHRMVVKFSELFKFNKNEANFFLHLVLFNQAKKQLDKNLYFAKLASFKEANVKTLGLHMVGYYEKWYYTVMRELLNFYPFDGDYAKLSKQFRPNIKMEEAKAAIELLKELKMIRRKYNGTFSLTDAHVTSGYHSPSFAVNNFSLATLDLAKESIDRIPKEERNISTLTFSASAKNFEKMQDKLRNFRREWIEMIDKESDLNTVYQLNFQLFPVTGSLETNPKE